MCGNTENRGIGIALARAFFLRLLLVIMASASGWGMFAYSPVLFGYRGARGVAGGSFGFALLFLGVRVRVARAAVPPERGSAPYALTN